ncbi:MAG: hypothetical protein LBU65_09395 [Planctomycetaceae bacterium]|nr:hypothetical protein [Planctomycetaceae bacterium]
MSVAVFHRNQTKYNERRTGLIVIHVNNFTAT